MGGAGRGASAARRDGRTLGGATAGKGVSAGLRLGRELASGGVPLKASLACACCRSLAWCACCQRSGSKSEFVADPFADAKCLPGRRRCWSANVRAGAQLESIEVSATEDSGTSCGVVSAASALLALASGFGSAALPAGSARVDKGGAGDTEGAIDCGAETATATAAAGLAADCICSGASNTSAHCPHRTQPWETLS